MDPKLIIAALGLPEGATIEQVTELAVNAKKNESAATQLREFASRIDALTGATGSESLVVVSGWKNDSADLAQAKEQILAAKAEAERVKKEKEDSDRDALVDSLVASGRLTGEERIAKAKAKSLAEVKDLAEFLPVALPGNPNGEIKPAENGSAVLTDLEKADAKSMGMSEEEYLKAKQNVAKKYSTPGAQ